MRWVRWRFSRLFFLFVLIFAVGTLLFLFKKISWSIELNNRVIDLTMNENSFWMKRMIYWKDKSNTSSYPIIKDRFLTWLPWEAGHNNRRMSLELAYVFAYLTNRTLVLPLPSGHQPPFPRPIYYEEVYDLDEMKKGAPVITHEQFHALPHLQQVLSSQVELNWTDIPYMNSCVGWPALPRKGSPGWEDFVRWRYPHTEGSAQWGTPHEPDQLPHFHTASVLTVPPNVLFTHFYLLFYFPPDSPIQLPNITTLVKQHLHFRKEVLAYAALVLQLFPSTRFSTIHYRRDDLQYEENRWLDPEKIFSNTLGLFEEEEFIYVATDERPEVFRREFEGVFEKRYRILKAEDFSEVLREVPQAWVPLVEMLILSQGRVFVGTRQSTFSGYVNRLRGYMSSIENKNIYWTIKEYPDEYDDMGDLWKTWEREYPEAWETTFE
eukprot:TRINITY_DN13436_c0_g2_i2.p1 TRINITY_DN13436_c0_g2~~TRINITY_DN13436_c0_g2_i2.p1  ORF type:complete len:435 (+),score=85.10 TRINITY_DN13436_c0_g2_i2:23-1327(+)